jgi:dihydropteroate synthase
MASRVWRCGSRELALDHALVMGILNLTPDSFSDGGQFDDPMVAVPHAVMMCGEGASIIDVGGESTRPGADAISLEEEIARTVPTLQRVAGHEDCPVSIDTRNVEVARIAVEVGAEIINDVSGFRDPAMVEFAASCDVGLVVMHMLGDPGSMQDEPRYGDVVAEISEYLAGQAEMLIAEGVDRDRICVDPGIGFGKTLEHNLEILRELPRFAALGFPVLVGVSRKSMIGKLTGVDDPLRRVEGSLGAAVWAALNGADIIRAHDVRETVQAVRVAEAIKG